MQTNFHEEGLPPGDITTNQLFISLEAADDIYELHKDNDNIRCVATIIINQ